MKIKITFIGFLLSRLIFSTQACTNLLVTPGASSDGSAIITYLADSHSLYGELYFFPTRNHSEGTFREIYDWDTGKPLGKIKEARHTYQVVGNMNEFQLTIAETTFGGRTELQDTTGILDYGSLIYITLQRTKTAREAIAMMHKLVNEYGYYSSGESFSIADPHEVWIMEMIGKGPGKKGAVWVARRIPDGFVCAHANQSRIQTFPLNDKKNCLYSPDVIKFAREKGYFKGDDKDFSFADAYAPFDFHAIRFCEARVWRIFSRIDPSINLSSELVSGKNTQARLPLWIKPGKPISVREAMTLMRDHYEGTPFDMTKGIGAGPYCLPYRWRPLSWKVDSIEYFNERAISTQQTAFSFVAQMRKNLPDAIGGVLWFGVDDSYSTVYSPFYCCMKSIPRSYAQGNGDLYHYNPDAAFWVFNQVSNFSYLRYKDMIVDVQKVQSALEDSALNKQQSIEETALVLYQQNPDKAINFLSKYSIDQSEKVILRWKQLFGELMVKYIDGIIKCSPQQIEKPGYSKEWYECILKESGDFYRLPHQ